MTSPSCLSTHVLRFLFLHCFLDDEVTVLRTGDSAFDHDNVRVTPHLNHLEALDRNLLIAHLPRHLVTLEDPSGGRVLAYRAAVPEKLMGAMPSGRARELVSLDDACKALSNGNSGDVDKISRLKQVYGNSATRLVLAYLFGAEAELLEPRHGWQVCLLEMAGPRLIDPRNLGDLLEPELQRGVSIRFYRLLLHDRAWPRLYNGNGDHCAILPEYLRHPELLPDQSDTHFITSEEYNYSQKN